LAVAVTVSAVGVWIVVVIFIVKVVEAVSVALIMQW
jgi:hypothetical protein